MADNDIQDMSAFEFAISCEYDCENPSVVMVKGCLDQRHVAVCEAHYEYVRAWFDSIPPHILCVACGGLPMLVFEHHYDIVPIDD